MTKVNNYWIQSQNYAGGKFGNSDWTRATYFYGNLAAYDIVKNANYLQYTLQWAQSNKFSLIGGSGTRNADRQAAGQVYMNLFQRPGSSSSYVTQTETSVLNRDTLSGSLSYVDWFHDTGGTWHRRLIPDAPTVLTADRGKLVADANNNIYAILPNLKIYAASYASGYTDWKLITNADTGRFSYEPLYDYYRLNNGDGVLSVYYQDRDNSTHSVSQYVLDYKIGGPRQHPNHALAATGATTTVSSSVGNFGWFKAAVNDGNEHSSGGSNGWSNNSNLTIQNHNEWVLLNLGNSYNITEVDLFGRDDSGNVGYGFPIDFTIQISNDGSCSTWTTVYTSPGGGYPQPTSFGAQRFTFRAQSARCIRVNGTKLRSNPNDNNQYRMQFAEIEVY